MRIDSSGQVYIGEIAATGSSGEHGADWWQKTGIYADAQFLDKLKMG